MCGKHEKCENFNCTEEIITNYKLKEIKNYDENTSHSLVSYL